MGMSDEGHRALKRWEKARQWAAMQSDPDLVSPPAWCLVKTASDAATDRILVYIVDLFAGDLTCVKACREDAYPGYPGGYWLVRGGIRWEEYLRGIVRHYSLGLAVPTPFRPLRKIGSEIIDQLSALPDAGLCPVFAKLRDSGLLPPMPVLGRDNCPQALAWETIRGSFQDFQGRS